MVSGGVFFQRESAMPRSGQYDDLDGAAWRAIADDDPPPQDAPAKR